MMVKFAVAAFALLSLQVLLTVFQINNYRRRICALRSKGTMGIGIQKGKLKAGSIIILVVSREGTVVDCEEMKGRTVFSRFNKANEYIGQNIYDLKKDCEKDKHRKNSAMATAIKSIETQFLKEEGQTISSSIQSFNN